MKSNSSEFNRAKELFVSSVSKEFSQQYNVKKVELIWNKNIERMFEGKLNVLSIRSTQPEFQPKWKSESDTQFRKKIEERFNNYISRFQPQPDFTGNINLKKFKWFILIL